MQFEITKSKLVEALSTMNEVATKGVKAEFPSAGRLTMEAKKDKVSFATTNGNMDAQYDINSEIDERLSVIKPGIVTVDSSAIKNICQLLGGKDSSSHRLGVELSDDVLKVRDLDAGKKWRNVKMQLFTEHHEIKIKKEEGFKYTFATDILYRGISSVNKYASKLAYSEDVMYYMICVHFLPNEIRFVCGNGVFFAVNCILGQTNIEGLPEEGKRYIIPSDQAGILLSVLNGCNEAEFNFTNSKKVQVRTKSGMDLEIKGIPVDDYSLAYENHAFQENNAKVLVDVKTTDLREAMALVMSCRDKELESQQSFHSTRFSLDNDALNLVVDEGRYQCEVNCESKKYDISANSYTDEYAAMFLHNVAMAGNNEFVRFYCVNEGGVMAAECLDLDNAKDDNGVHMRRDANNRLLFFFGSTQMGD